METVILKHYYQDKHLMIGKKKINQIKSLAQRKTRNKEQLFLVEGDKTILEVLHSPLKLKELFATESFLQKPRTASSSGGKSNNHKCSDIKKASLLKNPQNSLAVCLHPPATKIPGKLSGISFYLDGIQDPGNLGTILRICDWFGMEHIFFAHPTQQMYLIQKLYSQVWVPFAGLLQFMNLLRMYPCWLHNPKFLFTEHLWKGKAFMI
jgi:tRNA G18 (ribose-2'-O)-methylase SpoU